MRLGIFDMEKGEEKRIKDTQKKMPSAFNL
jgi:hypothetical protein